MKLIPHIAVAGLAVVVAACTTTPDTGSNNGRLGVLNTNELRQLLVGQTVDFGGESQVTYFADGRYEYRDSRTWRGRYTFRNNQVCVQFTNGSSRCDRYERTRNGYVLINGRGARFPASVG